MRIIINCIFILILIYISNTEEYRSYNGENNNLLNPKQGSVNQPYIRISKPVKFNSNSISNNKTLPLVRQISNIVFDQQQSIPSKQNLTQLFSVWGQFIINNIALSLPGNESWPILINRCDKFFDPNCTNNKKMKYIRTQSTEIQCDNNLTVKEEDGKCYEQINSKSSYIDGNVIYGNNEIVCKNLRTLKGGKMKMTTGEHGDLPPKNLTDVPIDNDSYIYQTSQLFSIGDRRGNENPGLLSIYTLFLREHNRLADKFKLLHPYWDDEIIFQHARSCIIEQIQKITYNEYLPLLLGSPLTSFNGYNEKINSQISNEFTTTAFRFGYSEIKSNIEYISENGTHLKFSPFKNTYFNPNSLNDGIEPIIRGLYYNQEESIDTYVISDIRNYLYGKPGQGGFDLIARTIQRNRDHGIGTYNDLRKQFGLKIALNWSDITKDIQIQDRLKLVYKSIDDLDAYVGGLAESPQIGGCVGQLFYYIISDQFYRSRSGDRFWYENINVKMFNHQCESTTFSDLIKRTTTNIGYIPLNVFKAFKTNK